MHDEAWPEKVPTVITGLLAGPHAIRMVLPGLPAMESTVELVEGALTELTETAPELKTTLSIRTVPAGAFGGAVLQPSQPAPRDDD